MSLSFQPASEATPVGGAEHLVICRPGWQEVLFDIRQRQKRTKWKFKLLLSGCFKTSLLFIEAKK